MPEIPLVDPEDDELEDEPELDDDDLEDVPPEMEVTRRERPPRRDGPPDPFEAGLF